VDARGGSTDASGESPSGSEAPDGTGTDTADTGGNIGSA
jgi:hypothetical protein